MNTRPAPSSGKKPVYRTREQWHFRLLKRALNAELYRTIKLHGETIPAVSGLDNKVAAFLSQHEDAVLRAAYERYEAAKL